MEKKTQLISQLDFKPSVLPQVLETCVKNCGHRFHVFVATRDFIDGILVKIITPKNNPPTIVQDKVLALIQVSSLIYNSSRPRTIFLISGL